MIFSKSWHQTRGRVQSRTMSQVWFGQVREYVRIRVWSRVRDRDQVLTQTWEEINK